MHFCIYYGIHLNTKNISQLPDSHIVIYSIMMYGCMVCSIWMSLERQQSGEQIQLIWLFCEKCEQAPMANYLLYFIKFLFKYKMNKRCKENSFFVCDFRSIFLSLGKMRVIWEELIFIETLCVIGPPCHHQEHHHLQLVQAHPSQHPQQ